MPHGFKLSHRLSRFKRTAVIVLVGVFGCTDTPSAPSLGSLTPTAALSTKFTIGDRVKAGPDGANIRATPSGSGTLLGKQPSGALGSVIGGPVVDSTGDKLTRWQVDFDAGVDGWAAEAYIVLVSSVPPPPPAPVASVTVSPATANVAVGAAVQLTAILKDSAGNTLSGRSVTWTSSDTAVARVSTSGLGTGVAAGSAAVTATSEGKSGSAAVTVTAPALGKFRVGDRVKTASQANIRNAPAASGLLLGAQPAGALGTVTGGPVVDSAGDKLTRWQVDFDSGVDGWAAESYLTFVSSGSTAPVASVSVTPATATVGPGGNLQLTVTLKDSAGNTLSGRTITWASSAAAVATVSATGLVTAVATGTATITATSEGKAGSSTITVAVTPVAAVTVSPSAVSLVVGGSAQLAAMTKDASGNTLTGRAVTWTTSNASVAIVSGSGLVSGVAAGSATVTATSEGKSGTAAIAVISSSTVRAGYYASPSGSSGGDGTITKPWDLRTALAGGSGKVRPGDTVWVRGGTYRGAFRSTVAGVGGAPVVIRNYPGERAIVDEAGLSGSTDGFVVAGPYEVIWGLEFMNSDPTRKFNDTGHSDRSNTVVNNAAHTRFINIVIHDGGNAFYAWPGQPDLEIYGAIIYNNGWDGTDRGHGHGLYLKNNTGPVVVRHSVLFNQFGLGFHGYSNAGDGGLTNIQIRDNVAFNNGTISSMSTSQNLLLGGEEPVIGGVVSGNFTYFSPGAGSGNVKVGYSGVTGNDVTVSGNYIVGGTLAYDMRTFNTAAVSNNILAGTNTMVSVTSAAGEQWVGNGYYRDPGASAWTYGTSSYTLSGWKQATGLGATDQAWSGYPSQTRVVVQPNQYERGRAHVIVYNWGRQGSIAADLSGALAIGSRYEVRSVQNLFGAPVASGTYGGGTIFIPLTAQPPPAPIGMASSPAPTTGPAFDVFLVTTLPN